MIVRAIYWYFYFLFSGFRARHPRYQNLESGAAGPTNFPRTHLEFKYPWQQKRVRSLQRFLEKRSPFYRQLAADASYEAFSDRNGNPIVNKSKYLSHFDAINTAHLKKDELFTFAKKAERTRNFTQKFRGLTVGLSSGTSGSQGLFVINSKEMAVYIGALFAKTLGLSLFRPQRIAFFLRANSNLYSTTGNFLLHRFRFFDLINDLDSYWEGLKKLNPTILIAPPTVLAVLAERQLAEGSPLAPRHIFSVADRLETHQKLKIEAAFKAKVRIIYQATEGFLGISCRMGTLHLNEDLFRFEKETLDGAHFYPIVTDLFRRTQPIMRYRMDDILTPASAPCPCGSSFTAIQDIQGRQDDIFFGTTMGGHTVPLLPDFVRRAAILCASDFGDFQIEQTERFLIKVALQKPSPEIYLELKTNLLQLFRDRDLLLPQIEFVPFLERDLMQKQRRVRRTLSPDPKSEHPHIAHVRQQEPKRHQQSESP